MTAEDTVEGNVPRVSIDRQHRQVYRAQLEVAKAVRTATEDAGLTRTLVELLNIRVSQINGCAYCLHVHVRAALAGGETAQRLAVLPAWRDTTLFTARERAALTLAESVTTLPDDRIQEQDYAEAAQHLTEDELSAVSWVAIAMNSFNRLSIVSRHLVRPQAGSQPPATGSHPHEGTPRDHHRPRQPSREPLRDLRRRPARRFQHLQAHQRTTIAFTHTEIDQTFAGRGLAKQLVIDELDDVRTRGLAVLPFCPYIRKIIAQNATTYLDLVPEKDRERFGLAEEVAD